MIKFVNQPIVDLLQNKELQITEIIMEIKDFIEQFIEAVEIEDSSTITPNTNFRDLDEWSSLSTLSVIALAEDEYEVNLTPDVFRKAQTVEDLFNAIQSLK